MARYVSFDYEIGKKSLDNDTNMNLTELERIGFHLYSEQPLNLRQISIMNGHMYSVFEIYADTKQIQPLFSKILLSFPLKCLKQNTKIIVSHSYALYS